MKTRLLTMPLLLITLYCNTIYADTRDDYFEALAHIQQLPKAATPITPCTLEEKQHFVQLYNKHHKGTESLTLDRNSSLPIVTYYQEAVELYHADFNNDGKDEYLTVTTGGTMGANTVSTYLEQNGQLIDINFDDMIIKSLLPKGDMSQFYYHTATPFAMKMDGKIYIRFMSVPYRQLDKFQLLVCTYLWQQQTIKPTNLSLRYDRNSGELVAADCFGHR